MKACWSGILVVLCCAGRLFAQEVAIEGTVLEVGTGIPVPNAKVVLRYAQSPAPLDTVTTEAPGTFRVLVHEVGDYALEADAPGFDNIVFRGDGAGIHIAESELEPAHGSPVRKFTIGLSRTGVLVGHVQDSTTQQPLRLVTVRALRYGWQRGKRQLSEARIAFTDEKGMFRLESLPEGEYILEFQKATLDSEPTPDFPQRYPLVLWPGGDSDNAPAFTVSGGMESNTGTFNYAKVAPGKLHGTAPSNCDAYADYQVRVQQHAAGALIERPQLLFQCGQTFSLAGVSPGSYRLLFIGRGENSPLIGSAETTVQEGADLDVPVNLSNAAEVTGRVVCECEKRSLAGLKIRFLPARDNGLASGVDVRDDGTFEARVAIDGPAHLDVQRLPPDLYVKRIDYASSEARGGVNISPGSVVSSELRIAVGPAIITGTVDKKNLHNHVVLAQWPVPVFEGDAEYRSTEVDDAGHFRIAAIAPGKYRIRSMTPAEWVRKDIPGTIEEWLASAQEITLAENETRAIQFDDK